MPKPLIHDHDGHVDDLLSCILLWLSPAIDLQAIGITNGDCYVDQIYEAMQKVATYLDIDGPEIAITEDDVPNQHLSRELAARIIHHQRTAPLSRQLA